MKFIIHYSCLLLAFPIIAQSSTDILIFDMSINNGEIKVFNMKNISNSKGYNNQPSFTNNNNFYYASSRDGQTDIIKYNIDDDSKVFITHSEGGEYSPMKIPKQNNLSAVRLDKDGKQRLYSYNFKNGESSELIPDLIIAYYTWYDENIIIAAVIEDNILNLYMINLKNGINKKIDDNVGRSFHKIPNTNLVSYISKKDPASWLIKSLNPLTGTTKKIAKTMQGVEDICWINNNTILSGSESLLKKLTLQKDENWKQIINLQPQGVIKITRLIANKKNDKLLIVAEF